MNSKSYADQANQYKCPLGRHWQIQEQALIAMLNLMENMVRHALHLLIGYFSLLWEGGRSANVWIFLSLPLYVIYFLFCSVSIIIIEGDWTTSWPEEEDQEDDISEGLNQFFYTDIYMSV